MASYFGFEPYQGNEPYAYLSYRGADRERVAPVAQELNKAGIRIWYDYGLTDTTYFDTQIRKQIKNSSIVLIFITDFIANNESSFVLNEFEIAKAYSKKIIPVFLDNIDKKNISSGYSHFYAEITCMQGIFCIDKDYQKCVKIISQRFPELLERKYSDEFSYDDMNLSYEPIEEDSDIISTRETTEEEKETLIKSIHMPLTNRFSRHGIDSIAFNQRIQKYKKKFIRKQKLKKSGKITLLTFTILLLYFFLGYIYSNTSNILDIANFICKDAKLSALLIISATFSIFLIVMISYSIKSILINQNMIELGATEEHIKRIENENNKNSRKLVFLIIPLIIINLFVYIVDFLDDDKSQIFMCLTIIIISIVSIYFSLEIKTYLIKLNSENKTINITKVACMFSLVLSTVIIFAALTHLMYLGNPNSYTEINYSSWYHEAFVFFYHSFSMCLRNESDIAVPITMLSQFISMLQICVCYFIILHEASDIFNIGQNKR